MAGNRSGTYAMRFILLFTAFILTVLIAVQFAGDAHLPRPLKTPLCTSYARTTAGKSSDPLSKKPSGAPRRIWVRRRRRVYQLESEVFQLQQLILVPGGVIVMGYLANQALARPGGSGGSEVAVTTLTPLPPAQPVCPIRARMLKIDAY